MDKHNNRRDEGRKRSRHHHSRSRSASRGDDDDDSYHRRRHKHKSKSRHKRDRCYDDDSSSCSESSTDKKRHSKKRHRKDKKKKHKKKKDKKDRHKKRSRHHSRSRSPSPSPIAESKAPPGAHALASALTQLFHAYPSMSSLDEGGIPLLFIQLSRGTEYNLSQMPDRKLACLLQVVFEALKVHGMEIGSDGAWKWGNAPKGGGNDNDLALLRLSRALLNGAGVTIDSVEKYEEDQMQKLKQIQQEKSSKDDSQVKATATTNAQEVEENEKEIRHRKRVERMTYQLLDRFDPKDSSSSESSLSNELQGICDVLNEGESIQLDGIENSKLKATLSQLFQLVGLELVEIDEEDSDDEKDNDSNNGEKAMGYALPDMATRDIVASNLNEVLRVCRFRSSGGSESAPTSWKSNGSLHHPDNAHHAQEESSSDDEDGPAPLGTVAAAKAAKRKRPPPSQNNKAKAGEIDEGGREEWMLVAGEHEFLLGISKSTKSRTFKNEKMRGQSIAATAASAQPINPQVLEEVNAIQKAYEQSRGPSLFDAHREKVQQKKEEEKSKKEWKWSRDKNLDEGRRVDKNALHMVLGGATNGRFNPSGS